MTCLKSKLTTRQYGSLEGKIRLIYWWKIYARLLLSRKVTCRTPLNSRFCIVHSFLYINKHASKYILALRFNFISNWRWHPVLGTQSIADCGCTRRNVRDNLNEHSVEAKPGSDWNVMEKYRGSAPLASEDEVKVGHWFWTMFLGLL